MIFEFSCEGESEIKEKLNVFLLHNMARYIRRVTSEAIYVYLVQPDCTVELFQVIPVR